MWMYRDITVGNPLLLVDVVVVCRVALGDECCGGLQLGFLCYDGCHVGGWWYVVIPVFLHFTFFISLRLAAGM